MAGQVPLPKVRNVDFLKTKIMQPALTSFYEVYILPPPEAKSFIDKSIFPGDITDLLTVSCCEATLPGSSLMTHELNNDFTGVTQRHAYRRLYDNQSDFTFYVNSGLVTKTGYDQIRYFEAWMRFITGEQVANAEDLTNFYRVRYPKKYKSPFIAITKFERNLGTKKPSGKMVYKFINAFPMQISSIPVSYEASQLLKVTVSFTYDRYVNENVASNQAPQIPAQTPANGTPISPFDLTPQQQASINSAFTQNLNLGNYSSGTFTDANYSGVVYADDPSKIFEQNNVGRINQTAFSGNFSLL